jgi:hypothetical protein
MGGSRAIMTDTERERLAGETDVEDIKIYQAKSRVRRRIEEELIRDVAVLEDNHPELLELLRDTVRADETDTSPDQSKEADTDETPTQSADSTEDTTGGERAELTTPQRGLRDVVTEVAQRWDNDAHFENRVEAAVEVLSHAVESGDPIGKRSDIVETAIEQYPVDGHSKQQYWRQTFEPVLSEAGEYSWGSDTYRVDELG